MKELIKSCGLKDTKTSHLENFTARNSKRRKNKLVFVFDRSKTNKVFDMDFERLFIKIDRAELAENILVSVRLGHEKIY